MVNGCTSMQCTPHVPMLGYQLLQPTAYMLLPAAAPTLALSSTVFFIE